MKKRKQQQVDLRPRRRSRSRFTFAFIAGVLMACGILSYIAIQSPEHRAQATGTALAKTTQTAVAVLNEQRATASASRQPTETPSPTTPTDAPRTDEARTYRDLTVYALSEARLRTCPATDCDTVAVVSTGTALPSDYSVVGEDAFGQGERNWYRVLHNGREAFVYAALVALNPPSTSVPSLPEQTWNCSGDIYNCSDFANRRELESYWSACPGDPSRLDGNPKNGVPCDSSWR